MSLLLILLLLLQTSFFQNYLAGIAIDKLNKQTRQNITFTNLKIKWFDFVEIKGLQVSDYKSNPMFYASKVEVDYELNRLFEDGSLSFDKVNIENGDLFLVKYEDTLGINLSELLIDLNNIFKKPSNKKRKAIELRVGGVRLDEFNFSYNNWQKDSLPEDRFDYGHFKLDIPVAYFQDFNLRRDTIAADIRSFVASDPVSGLEIENLESKFSVSNSMLSLMNLRLETPNSLIRDFVELKYSGLEDLGYFTDSVHFDMNITRSVISKKDLSYFAKIPLADFSADISARISGTVPKLSMENLQLAIGSRTHLVGNIDFTGLPKIDETFIDAAIKDGEIYPDDIEPFVGLSIDNLRQIGDIRFSGQFLGFTNDFVANADFHTDEGFVSSDLNLKFPKDWKDASYSGKLMLENFNVGKYLNDTLNVKTVNLKGEIDGTGLTMENAQFYLNASFKNSVFIGYKFKEIKARGEFASEFFTGEIAVKDPNCMIQSSGTINLESVPEQINLSADVGYLNLQKLGLVKTDFELASKIRADVSGLRVDDLQGVVSLTDVQVKLKGEDSVSLDSVRIASFKNGKLRDINIAMPELDLKLEGDFDFTTVAKDFRVIADEFKSYFEPEFDKRVKLVSINTVFENYTIDFSIAYEDLNKYLDLLSRDIYVSPNGKVEGTYYQRQNATLSLFSEVDSINYRGIGYNNNVLDLNFSKDLDSLGIIASVFIHSQEQKWRNIKPTKDLTIEAVWFNNKIDLNVNVDQPDNKSKADIKAEMKLAQDRLVFRFLPSNIIVFGDQWYFNPYNKIEIDQQRLEVDRLELYQNSQSILLKGSYSESRSTNLMLNFTDFNLEALSAVLPVKLSGVFNSNIEMFREETADNFKLTGDIMVDEFRLNDFPVGSISGTSEWNEEKKGLYIDMDVERESVNTIDIKGYYMPGDSTNQLDIEANFNEASLVLLSPIVVGLASDIRGAASGELNLTGFLDHPVLNGKAEISDGRFTFDLLRTVYDFAGDVDFDNRAINFNGLRLRDRDGDLASLTGALRHDGLKNFSANLNLAANNFMFLNTTSSDNKLYYGTVNATGDISIRGPFEDLYIKAQGTTNKGTKVYLPLSGEEDISQKNYITFVNFSDTTSQIDLNQIVQQSITGVTLDFEIDVTTDAYVEMIFDIRTGDIIRGRGEGSLSFSLDTNGEFELFGDITIQEGAYNFTIPNLINKEFSIVPGSTISWYGDPMAGILNLEATYRQLASFNDLKQDQEQDQSISPKHAILVVLDLTGEMLSPSIEFEIRYDNSQGTLPTNDQLLLDQINIDEQELKRQVFSLLILRKFTPRSQFSVSGVPVQGSLSEFLSNQFSYYISQVDENLEVDFDLASLDQDAFNTFQLRLAYTFFDGRLRVSGGGAFPQNTPEGTTAAGGDFIGNWSVRYLLTPDGHLRIKAFSQSEQFAGDWQRESGVSFQYLKSFDDLKELLSKTREEAIRTKPKDMTKEKKANQQDGT